MSPWRAQVLVCAGAGCVSCGCRAIRDAFRQKVARHGLQQEVKVIETGCIGSCNLGPLVLINPEGVLYHKVAPQDVEEIVVEHLLNGRLVGRLLYKDPSTGKAIPKMEDMDFFKYQQKLADELGIREMKFTGEKSEGRLDNLSPSVVRDRSKCILCRRCVTVCKEVQEVAAISMQGRGFKTRVEPAFGESLNDVACALCGQCILVCPVGAIHEKEHLEEVWHAIFDPSKFVVVQDAPAVRAALGEEFGYPPGTLVTGKMLAAVRRLGFDRVFDTNFAADLTIIEEGHELLKRIKEGGMLPMITSCSPGWVKFIEHFYPELLPHLSTCKSPHQMLGALVKTYYAQKVGVDPKDMVVVSVMPCTAKKFECNRPEMNGSGYKDVDYVITTRELAKMIKQAGIDFASLEDGYYDDPLGEYSGAGTIFGATGGVMEVALRTVYELVTGKTLERLEFTAVRGLEDIKEAVVPVEGLGELKVAVAHGLGNARKILDRIKDGSADYHFIEIMCCPGGCVGGGGQPLPVNNEIRMLRARALYQEDEKLRIRKSHENPSIKRLYEEFGKLGEMYYQIKDRIEGFY